MGKQLIRQTPKGMPTAGETSEVVSRMQKPFLVAGSRAIKTRDNRSPSYDIHANFQFSQGNLADFSSKQAIIFLHGYNTTSSEALGVFKQFFNSLTVAFNREPNVDLAEIGFCGFTWPGDTGGIYFNEAQEYAHYSGVALYKLITEMHGVGATSVSLISHSLGAHVLLRALSILGERLYRGHDLKRVQHALLLGAAVEDDVFERPELMAEYHFPESAFGLVTSRGDEVISGPFIINERDKALGFNGPESMRPLQSLARRVKDVLGDDEKFVFEVHDFSPKSAVIMNPKLWVDSHGGYWNTQEQLNYYINLLKTTN